MNILFLMKYYSLGGVEMVTNVLASRFLDNGCRVSIVSFIEPSNEILCRKDSRIIYYLLSGFNTSKKNIDQLRNILIEEKIDIVINQWGLPYVPIYVLKKGKTYYYRVRAYKYNDDGSKVYSKYSKVKAVKIK